MSISKLTMASTKGVFPAHSYKFGSIPGTERSLLTISKLLLETAK